MLTAKGDITDKVNGLDIGADDYLTKHFEIEELLARIRVILRRKSQAINQSKIIQVVDLKLDLEKKQVSRNDKNIELTKREYELLEYLMKNTGKDIELLEFLSIMLLSIQKKMVKLIYIQEKIMVTCT